jgi:hypothetical protein
VSQGEWPHGKIEFFMSENLKIFPAYARQASNWLAAAGRGRILKLVPVTIAVAAWPHWTFL